LLVVEELETGLARTVRDNDRPPLQHAAHGVRRVGHIVEPEAGGTSFIRRERVVPPVGKVKGVERLQAPVPLGEEADAEILVV
jgi:hypothetical protein